MKRIAFLLIIVSCLFSFQSENLIPWKENRKLTWDDFKGKPNTASPYKALTESSLSIDIRSKGQEAIVVIKNAFDKNTSWVKEKRDDLLQHEQTHFDISELWARKFKQRLKGKTFNVKTFQQELTKLHAEVNKGGKSMNADYDKETEHSINAKAQEKWTKRVNADLKSLSEFALPEVSCQLSK